MTLGKVFPAATFFFAYVVTMAATFGDVASLAAPWASPVVLCVCAALAAAGVLAHARIPSRLPPGAGGYVALAGLAAAQAWTLAVASPYLGLARAALMLGVALVLLRVQPRTGNLYQGQVMPGFTTLLAFTALISMSLRPLADLAAVGLTHPALERIPGPMANVFAAAVLAAAFILLARLRRRSMQPNPARAWLLPGIAIFLAAAAAMHSKGAQQYARFGLAAAHLLLFIGSTYLLSHLLPSRATDEMA